MDKLVLIHKTPGSKGTCANGLVCPAPTNSQCKEAGYPGQTEWYATHVVQKSIGGLDFKDEN